MKVLHFAGPSGMGKTRLIAALLPFLPATRILKWTHHPLGDDKPGSDTQLLGGLGIATILASPDGLLIRETLKDRHSLYRQLAHLLADDDLVVVEGHKNSSQPKIWLGTDPPSPAVLVIGPTCNPGTDWLETALPITNTGITTAVNFLQQHWMKYTYTVARSPHE